MADFPPWKMGITLRVRDTQDRPWRRVSARHDDTLIRTALGTRFPFERPVHSIRTSYPGKEDPHAFAHEPDAPARGIAPEPSLARSGWYLTYFHAGGNSGSSSVAPALPRSPTHGLVLPAKPWVSVGRLRLGGMGGLERAHFRVHRVEPIAVGAGDEDRARTVVLDDRVFQGTFPSESGRGSARCSFVQSFQGRSAAAW